MPKNILKYCMIVLILVTGITTDQVSKGWAARNLKYKPQRVLIKSCIELGYTENHGMVFGINNNRDNSVGRNILLAVRIVLSIGLIGYVLFNIKKGLLFHVPFLMILSGAAGNVIDSLRYGHVIDFIHMHLGKILDWPFLYNLADAYVCIGMGILVIQSFISPDKKGSPSVKPRYTDPPGE